MTQLEAEKMFRQELKEAIEKARKNDLGADTIAYWLRSIASDVSKQWNAECDRRNAERIAQMNAQAAAQHNN